MKVMKKALSVFLVIAMLSSLFVTSAMAENETPETDDYGESEAKETDFSGKYYDDIFCDGDSDAIVAVDPDEGDNTITVSYIAEKDTTLSLRVLDEDADRTFLEREIRVSAGKGSVSAPVELQTFPKHYLIIASLAGSERTFTYYDHSRVYEEFLQMTPDDECFSDRLALDYGEGIDGRENFVVVKEDVKVVRVPSLDDVEIQGKSEDNAALFGILEGAENSSYTISDTQDGEILSSLKNGDRLMILPLDDVSGAQTFVVGDVEKNASLLSGEDGGAVTVTTAEAPARIEDFFDYVRIQVEVEADSDDIDTTGADSDVSVEENAELLGSASVSRSKSKTFSINTSIPGGSIRDSFTVTASVSLSINYSWSGLQRVSATASLSVSNNFTVQINKSVSISRSWYVGTIPVGTVGGVVVISVPVYVTFYASCGGSFYYSNTFTASGSVTATYQNGYCSATVNKSGSSGRNLTVSAYATIRLGVKACVEMRVLIVNLKINLNAEAGIQISVVVSNKKKTITLYIYFQPSCKIIWLGRTLVNKTWSMTKWRIGEFTKAVYITMQDAYDNSDEWLKSLTVNSSEEEDEKKSICINIQTAQDLETLAKYTNEGRMTAGVQFLLNLKEDMLDISSVNNGVWTPIGDSAHPFQGEFDGAGVTITGLKTESDSYCGLFGATSGAEIHDVTLKDCSVKGAEYVGALVGDARENSAIYNVLVSGTVSGQNETGGIVGRAINASILNCGCAAQVTGTESVGGIAGTLILSEDKGQISNCYSVGAVSVAEADKASTCGAICGDMTLSTNEPSSTDEASYYPEMGITYCYYLADSAAQAVGTPVNNFVTSTYSVTEAQAKGIGEDKISNEDGFASETTLLGALNRWYATYGTNAKDNDEALSNPKDWFHRWKEDKDNANNGFPVPDNRGILYPLTVFYVYADGSEAFPPLTLYRQFGATFDVDVPAMDGFHTNADTEDGEPVTKITGYMCANPQKPPTEEDKPEEFEGLEFRFVYVKNSAYAGQGKSLSALVSAAGKTYQITDAEDLQALADYVSNGGETKGAVFEQTAEEISLSGVAWQSIGTDEAAFRGSYKGNGQNISGLTGALFGLAEDAEIDSVHVSGALSPDGTFTALLAAKAKNAVFRNCSASVATPDATVSGAAGALAGSADECQFLYCSANGALKAAGDAGGIAGTLFGGKMVNCASSASIESSENGGGLAGSASSNAVIQNSYASGQVTGAKTAGGLVGSANSAEISNCYGVGAVTGAGSAGALIGTATDISGDNLYFLTSQQNAVGEGSLPGANPFSADSVKTLMTVLNKWVKSKTSGEYMTWSEYLSDEGSSDAYVFPTFGAPYKAWLMDFHLNNGTVSYYLDSELSAGYMAYMVTYGNEGQTLEIYEFPTPYNGEGTVTVSGEAVRARAFLVDKSCSPVYMSVWTAN